MTQPDPLLLDTHVWVDFVSASPRLRSSSIASIEAARLSGCAFVSVISVWEVALLARVGRLQLNTSVTRWTEVALSRPGIRLLPFTSEIAISSVDLPDPMHKDPADRILIASARAERLTLVTRDRDILTFARTLRLPCLQA